VNRGDHRTGRQSKTHQRGFGQLQARFDGFRHGIGRAEAIEMARVIGVARPRNDQHVRPHSAHVLDDFVDQIVGVDSDDDACGIGEAANFQELWIGGVAVIHTVEASESAAI
jgi:hypothetical protein